MICDLSVCKNQIFRFFRYLDERDYAGLMSLMTREATWHRQGRVLVGPSQVHEALKTRSVTMRIAHIITNLFADGITGEECTMHAYMLVVRHEPGCERPGPFPLQGIESIRPMHFNLKRDGEQWLISEIRGGDVLFSYDAQEAR